MLGEVDRLLRAGLHALLKYADRLLRVQIVEDDSFITAYGNYLPYFVWINPTHVNVCSNVVRIAKFDKAHVLAAVEQCLVTDCAYPLRRAPQEIIEDRPVMRGQVPQRVHVVADRSQ